MGLPWGYYSKPLSDVESALSGFLFDPVIDARLDWSRLGAEQREHARGLA